MKIILNQQAESLPDNISIMEMLRVCCLPQVGVAIAVNNRVIAKSLWGDVVLSDGDHVVVITAACGG